MEKSIIITISIEEFKAIIQEAVSSELVRQQETTAQSREYKNEYLSRKQAAKILGISLPTLSKYIKEGLIPARRLSRKVLLERKEVEASMVKIRTVR